MHQKRRCPAIALLDDLGWPPFNAYQEFDGGLPCVGLLGDAVDALLGTEEVKRGYLDLTNVVQRLYKAVLPDPEAKDFAA